MDDMCACGKPLHYTNATAQRAAANLVQLLGPDLKVKTADGTWLVPRHYIALHGLKATELPQLAERYGFRKLP